MFQSIKDCVQHIKRFKDLKVVILESHNTTNKNNTLMAWVSIVLVDIIDNKDQCFKTPVDVAVMFSQNNLISFHNQNMLLTGSGGAECTTFGPIHTRQSLFFFTTKPVIASILQVWMEMLTSTTSLFTLI